ncbi:MAG: aminomethyltransferase family protein, partial [Acidimicrobiia bacterium]|nr:aminomethyltransferase family protein [Acidimicrobiia bacterium]
WAAWEAEHRACREGVIAMDMSFMAKFRVEGPGAGAVLDRLSANAVDGETGTITYTQWLNERGTIEADLTVTKLEPGTLGALSADGGPSYLVVATDTAHRHVHSILARACAAAAGAGGAAFVFDATAALAQINLQGPRSREVLAEVTSADVSDGAVPYRAVREIDVGFARVLAVRITYLGELGYELYVPAEQAVHVYDRLVAVGERFGLRHAGLRALSSLRLEKGYRDYGHDIDNTDGPLEAGFGFALALDKPGGFVGLDAVLAVKAAGPLQRRLVSVLITDPEPLLHHAEVLRRDGRVAGYVRAGSYGHTLGGAVGLAMVDAGPAGPHQPVTAAWLDEGEWTVDIARRRWPARVSLRPLYDPANERIKA